MNKIKDNLKFTSSMNARDLQLVTILGFIILCFLSYYFIISPAWDKSVILRGEEIIVKAEISKAESNIANIATLRIQDLKQKEDINKKYEIFFNDLKTERLLYVLDSYFVASGFEPNSIENGDFFVAPIAFDQPEINNYSYPLLEMALKSNKELFELLKTNTDSNSDLTNPQNNEATTVAEASKDKMPSDSVLNLDMTLKFAGSGYDNMISFIKTLENMNKAIAIKNISLSKSAAGTGIDGEVVITLYSVRKVDSTQNDYLVFLPQIPRGKGNPFS